MKIKSVIAREILDSRGLPTLESELIMDDETHIYASVPSGASVSKFEAVELRDGDPGHFLGRGVKKAASKMMNEIAPIIINKEPDFIKVDKELIALDGTSNKSNIGANTILLTSLIVAKAQAYSEGIELYELFAKIQNNKNISFPRIIANILNGGVHAANDIAFQEFSIVPFSSLPSKAIEIIFLIYQNLGHLLKESHFSQGIGDEGGFAPSFKNGHDFPEKTALDFLVKAIARSGYNSGEVRIFLDVAASSFYDVSKNLYVLEEKNYTSSELINLYCELSKKYPISGIEDGLDQEDWDSWIKLEACLGSKIKIIGDDIFATNISRIESGINKKAANSVIIKPNQIGTLTQTLSAISLCKQNNWDVVVSHRSGETLDTSIVDLAIGSGADFIKIGAPARGERIAKYNRLLKIEELIS